MNLVRIPPDFRWHALDYASLGASAVVVWLVLMAYLLLSLAMFRLWYFGIYEGQP